MEKKINYVKGNALEPEGNGKKIIMHICNNKKAWGAGFVLAISKKWKLPEQEYRNLSSAKCKLGNVQFILVEDDILIANMIAQDDLKPNEFGVPPCHLSALYTCLERVQKMAKSMNATVHAPRIGAGLGGMRWSAIEFLIQEVLTNNNIDVTIYDLKQ